MRQLRELLRLKYAVRLPHRAIAASLSISAGAVSTLTRAAAAEGLTWPLPAELDDEALERLIYGAPKPPPPGARKREPDYAAVHAELARKGMTLQLLWEEYSEALTQEDAYSRSQFCQLYRDWCARQPLSMRQVHLPGDKLFIDYAGPTLAITDPNTGEIAKAQVFVAVLGYSNFTYAEATWTQSLPDWIGAHTRALHFFGGVPKLCVPDNLKSGINKACRYDPEHNPTYAHWANHYAVAVLPARPRKPKDKAKAEVAVQIVERWIMARLRRQTFFSLSDANAALRPLLDELNHRLMRAYGQSRHERFEREERAHLSPLPATDYCYTEIKRVRVGVDCHVDIERHYYSVPHALVRQELQAFCTAERITLKHRGNIVASHARSMSKGGHTTLPEHLPERLRAHAEWTTERFIRWANKIGVACSECVERLFAERAHPEQAYRVCLGLLSLGKRYGDERLERACVRALHLGAVRLKTLRNILDNGLDKHTPETPAQQTLPLHDNLRGAGHYH